MNNLRNSVRLIGNIGMNPEVKEIGKDKKLAKFSLATTEVYKNDDGEKVSDTQWHNLIAWGNQAVFSEKYLKKGYEVKSISEIILFTNNPLFCNEVEKWKSQ